MSQHCRSATAERKPKGNTSQSIFNLAGQEIESIDGNGHVTINGLDPLGRVISVTDPDNNVTEKIFDAAGNDVENIDANSNAGYSYYNPDDQLVSSVDGLGQKTSNTLNADGETVQVTDPLGGVQQNTFDKNGRQISATNQNGNANTTTFDAAGQVLTATDGNLNSTFNGYNADGQETGNSLATGPVSKPQYDSAGREISFTDPDGNTTRFLLDADGNVVASIDPLGHSTYASFDHNNEQTLQVDADGRKITDTFDADGLKTSEIWLAANGAQNDSLAWSYDKDNEVVSESNSYGGYVYTRDNAERITKQVDPFNLALNFTDDANGNIVQITDSDGGTTTTSVYNADNLLTRRSFSGGPNGSQARIDIFYTSNNQVDHLNRYSDTAGNNLIGKQQNTWDKAGDLTEIKDTNASGTVLEDFTYQWDNGQRLTSETDTISGTPTTTNYGYDKANQLTSAGSNNYNYDLNGNRNTGGSVVGADNQLTTDGAWNYHYGPEGDMTQKVGVAGGPDAGLTWNYGYSNKNQLDSAVETNAQNQVVVDEEIKYDFKGQRVEVDVTQNGSTTYLKEAYDLEGDAWADLSASLALQDRRLYLDAVDALFASIGSTGNLDDYLNDHLGSVRGLENTGGTLDDAINYTVWGTPTDSNPGNGDRYKFTGREWDSAISLQYNRARYYDSSTGRWMSQDPLGFDAGDSNLYRYVKNQPIINPDPSGERIVKAYLLTAAQPT